MAQNSYFGTPDISLPMYDINDPTQVMQDEPTKLEIKQSQVTDKTLQKIQNTQESGFRKDMLLGMDDADSFKTELYPSTRSGVEGNKFGYDAIELDHWYGNAKPIIEGNKYKRDIQPKQVSTITGKPIDELTNQDYIDVGNMQQIQKVSDLARSEGQERWIAPFIPGVGQADLTGEHAPLNIPIGSKYVSQAAGSDRAVIEALNPNTNINVTKEAMADPRLNASLYKQGVISYAEAMAIAESEEEADVIDRTISGTKGAVSMFASGVVGLGDLVVDSAAHTAQAIGLAADVLAVKKGYKGFSDISKENLKNMGMERGKDGVINVKWLEGSKEYLDKEFGINATRIQKERNIAAKEAKTIYDNSDKYTAIELGEQIAKFGARYAHLSPEAVGDSLGFLGLLMFGGGSRLLPVGSSTIKTGGVTEKILSTIGQTAPTLNKAGKAIKGSSTVTAKNVPGILSIYNDNLTEYKKNNEGKMPTTFGGHAQLLGAATLEGKLDYVIDSSILKSTGLVNSFTKQITKGLSASTKEASKNVLKSTLKGLVSGSAKFTEAILKEMPTEGLQSLMSNVSQQYGTELYKDKTFMELVKSDKNIEAMWEGAVVGAAGGGGMSVIGSTKEVVAGKVINNIINNHKTKQTGTKEKPTNKEDIEVRDRLVSVSKNIDKIRPEQLGNALQALNSLNIPTDRQTQELYNKTTKAISDRMSEKPLEKDVVLGSRVAAEVFIEEVYATSKDADNKILEENLQKVANQFNIPVEEVQEIKTRAKVEYAASKGVIGYETYSRRFKALNENPKDNKKAIESLNEQLYHFEQTQANRQATIQKALSFVEGQIAAGKWVKKGKKSHSFKLPSGGTNVIHTVDGKIDPYASMTIEDIGRTLAGIQKVYKDNGITPLTAYTKKADKSLNKVANTSANYKNKKATIEKYQRIVKAGITTDGIFKIDNVGTRSGETGKNSLNKEIHRTVAKHLYSIVDKEGNNVYTEVDGRGVKTFGTGMFVKASDTIQEEDATASKKNVINKLTKDEELNTQEKEYYKTNKEDVDPLVTKNKNKIKNKAEYTPNVNEFDELVDDKGEVIEAKGEEYLELVNELEHLKETLAQDVEVWGAKADDPNIIALRKNIKDIENSLSVFNTGTVANDILDNSSSKGEKPLATKSKGEEYLQELDINKILSINSEATTLLASTKANILGTEISKIASNILASLNNIIVPIKSGNSTYKDQNGKIISWERFALKTSPARALLYDTEGNIDVNVAGAIGTALQEVLAYNSNALGIQSKKDVARFLEGGNTLNVSKEAYDFLKDKGVLSKSLANDLGKATLTNLGYKRHKDISEEVYTKLVADLGNMAILTGVDNGTLEFTKAFGKNGKEEGVSREKYNKIVFGATEAHLMNLDDNGGRKKDVGITFVRFKDLGKAVNNDKIREDIRNISKEAIESFDKIQNEIGIEDTYKKEPTAVPTVDNSREVRNMSVTEQSDKAHSVLTTLKETEFMSNTVSIKWLKDNEELAKEHLGYIEEDQFDALKLSYLAREKQIVTNREIIESLDSIDQNKLDKMYFDWFYSKNGRYMMDTNTINPQTDKLHRFLFVPSAHEVEHTMSEKDVSFIGDITMMGLFKISLAQAFGTSTDKKLTVESLKIGNDILENHTAESLEALLHDKEAMKDSGLEVEHLSHYLQGLEAVTAYQNAKANGDKTFTSNLSMESDAVTSGFALKLMQMPILGDSITTTYKWLKKTGIFVNGKVSSMNDEVSKPKLFNDDGSINEDGGFFDSYQELASEMSVDKLSLKGLGEKGYEAYKKAGGNKLRSEYQKLLPTIGEDNTISSELRNLFKYPFMTFNYSRGIAAIKRSIGDELAVSMIDKMLKGEADGLLSVLENTYGKDLVNTLQTTDPTKIMPTSISNSRNNLFEQLAKVGREGYGTLATNSLSNNFSEYVESNNSINKAFKAMFTVYYAKYNERVKIVEKKKGGTLSNADKLLIIKSLRTQFPLIRGPFSSDKELADAIAIVSTSSSVPEYQHGKAQTAIIGVDGKEATKTVNSLIRHFEAAGNAGSVIPIHYLDAAIIGDTILNSKGIVSIHDAIIPSLATMVNDVKMYNESTVETNKSWNMVEQIYISLERVSKDNLNVSFTVRENGQEVKVTIGDTLKEFSVLNDKVKERREELYAQDMEVVHMSAVPGSKYSYSATPNKTKVEQTLSKQDIIQLKHILLTANGKVRSKFQELLSKNNIDLKDC